MIIDITKIKTINQAEEIFKNCPICSSKTSPISAFGEINCSNYVNFSYRKISLNDEIFKRRCPFSYFVNSGVSGIVRFTKDFVYQEYSCGYAVGIEQDGTKYNHFWVGDNCRCPVGLDAITEFDVDLENIDITDLYIKYNKFIAKIPKLLLLK